ncbi:Septum site-determining protein MinC [Polaromonas vacuolata]|uniref:Probable septum site-determining protein MinC n=1 Tax=Polaromonas vacuolata TaxID=37448 RepID=A0A6H2H5G7_9BURK|nr:septum site-determining protein MinC [Polaromonas vacuolata]QJC54746.1 Septum site-determining protein MinC [Polaromonas vacuolata]
MTVATTATTPLSFEIKSANLALVALMLKSTDLALLGSEFKLRFGDIPDFFDQDALVIDLTPLQSSDTAVSPIDITALIALLRQYRLQPMSIRGGNESQMAAGQAAGLIAVPDAYLNANAAKNKAAKKSDVTVKEIQTATPVSTKESHTLAVNSADSQLSAMIIDKPLRSGQQVYARGRDLVVMAMVNAGAEVIADGHIHVYAPLRGKAMAGARGNTDARIFALSMEAELLSIAGVYRTSEHKLPTNVFGKPTQIRLMTSANGDKLILDPLSS